MTIRRVRDEHMELSSELGDGSGYSPGPIELRPGSADGTVRMAFAPGEPGREVVIRDLRIGLDAVEKEEW